MTYVRIGGIVFMVLERLEALPVGRFHYKLLLVTGLVWPHRQYRPHRHGPGGRRVRHHR